MTLVKICGITNLEDALVAIDAGADLLGFNFYPKSSRYVGIEAAKEIVSRLRERRAESGDQKLEVPPGSQSPISNLQSPHLIGLFVNESPTHILEILDATGLDYAQLHGDETPHMLAMLGGRGFKALRVKDATVAHNDAVAFTSICNSPLAIRNSQPALLVDSYDPNAYGGTGKRGDWAIAATVCQQHERVLLAGGLTSENVAEAIRTVHPWGVDVSSGVETTPGKKDAEKVRAFVQAAKSE